MLNHAEVHVAMWAGQRVLCLLQNLFKQSKLSLPPILARDISAGAVVAIIIGTLERRA